MRHIHDVLDKDTRFSINEISRTIKNEASKKTSIVQHDHNSERFTFELPRYIEGHDMSLCNKVEVHYLNIDSAKQNQNSGLYTVTDLQICADDKNKVMCSWLISQNATQYAGSLNFMLRFCCVEGDVITYAWNTAIYTHITISAGIDAAESFETDYVDVIERWKEALLIQFAQWEADTVSRMNKDITAWKETESGNVRGVMNEYSAQWNQALAVERSRIDAFVALDEGSTTGDAELQDIRIGADGVKYDSAGTAVRSQTRTIANRLSAMGETSLNTGATEGNFYYEQRMTDSNIEECTTQGMTPSQAYSNGLVFDVETRVVGIKLLDTITATRFGVFAFDITGTLIHSVPDLTPEISGGAFYLDDPIIIPAGGYMLVRFLDGKFYYNNTGDNTLKEYQPGNGSLISSPIRIGIDFIYTIKHEVVIFKDETILPSIQTGDFLMPRFVVSSDDDYIFVGRWFDYTLGNRVYKATNAAGSSLAFRVRGATKLNVGLFPITKPNHTPYFAYSVDGGDFVRQKITDTTIPIFDKLEHWVWIVIDGMGENDPISGGKWYGSVGIYFSGVTTDGELNGANFANRRIMFVGDSIVEGINVLGEGANADTNSAINGFAFKTARLLNAIPLLCGYGGTAILGNASFHKPIEAIDYNMNGVSVNEQSPDIIIIEHGYNDGTLISGGTYTEDDFISGYNALINRIKVKYPGIPIICVIPFSQSLKTAIENCAANRAYCYVIPTDGWGVSYTDDAHPDMAGAAAAAENLAKAILKIFGKQYFVI